MHLISVVYSILLFTVNAGKLSKPYATEDQIIASLIVKVSLQILMSLLILIVFYLVCVMFR